MYKKDIAIQQPKKDNCDFCQLYKVGGVTEDEYTSHREHVDLAREIKAHDKLSHADCLVFT